MKYGYLLFLATLFACNQSSLDPEIVRWEEQANRVKIIRDDYGVPHIYGETDADAVFGLLYAQCEDDFPRVERNYIWAIGRLSEVEGEEMLYSDLRARLFMSQEEAIEKYETSPKWLRALCDAFADGINYYLHTHPEVKPKLLTRFEPWMPMYFSEGSIGGDIERVSIKGIREFYEDKALQSSKLEKNDLPLDYYQEPVGSNGIAVSGKLTESGNAMLLINPHTSFFFRGEVHVVSNEGLNAYGAVTWGQFFVYQGFNEKTGWMHTSTYTDVIDEFKEKIIEKDGKLFYKYGEELKSVKKEKVVLNYLSGDSVLQKKFPIYKTHHGPITHKIGKQWVATAMMWEPVKALTQSYIRTKQTNLSEFHEMMDMRTNSSNNTVFADGEGNIAYYHGNFIPIRDTTFNYQEPVDGSDPKTDWQGLHPVNECIVVANPENGWLQNCNSTPFTCAGSNSPKSSDFPKYMSLNRERFRAAHAIELLENANDLTLAKMIDLAYDPILPAFQLLVPGLTEAFKSSPGSDSGMKEAIELLENWDYKVDTGSVAMTLAHFYGMNCFRFGKVPSEGSWMENVMYFGNASPKKERLKIMSITLKQLTDDFGTWKVSWGNVNRYQRLSGAIENVFDDNQPSTAIGLASGRWGALASFGARAGENTKKIYGTHGNSFVAVVEFGERLKAKSLLAGGQSGDPASPHFDDQVDLYAQGEFKDVAFYKEDVKARAKRIYRPGNTGDQKE